MIDALFGSKTRVKLLHLFLNNTDKSFYVREITRIVDEQINSVRRELSNMLSIGIITSDTSDNKLYYGVNHDYEHLGALRAIFSDKKFISDQGQQSLAKASSAVIDVAEPSDGLSWKSILKELPGIRIAIASGSLVHGSKTGVDLLIVADTVSSRLKKSIALVEKKQGKNLNYSIMPYDEFYYRFSIHDRFITEILSSVHVVVVDTDNVLKG